MQINHKYSSQMVELFRDTFCWLPLAHVLDKRVLVMHGGLFSKDGVKLSDIRSIDRHRSVQHCPVIIIYVMCTHVVTHGKSYI